MTLRKKDLSHRARPSTLIQPRKFYLTEISILDLFQVLFIKESFARSQKYMQVLEQT